MAQVLAETNRPSVPFHRLFPVSGELLDFPDVESQEALLLGPFHMLLPAP